MANHIQNRLEISGNAKEVAKVLNHIKGDGKIDFDKIKKMPTNDTTVEWAYENWGTKWLAYDQDDKRTKGNVIYFKTANNPPDVLIKYLSKQFPNVFIFLDYADEHKGENVGKIKFKGGKMINYKPIKNFSKEAVDLFYNLHHNKKSGGLRGIDKETTLSLSAYKTAAERVNWQNQKEMYQQGHEFFLNYYQLYADNKNNDIGEFLDLHYGLVINYQGGKIKASASYENSQKSALEKTIATLEKSQKYNNSEAVAKTISTLKKSLKYL